MVIDYALENTFVPEWNGNKDDANPITVTYKNPTIPLYNKLIPKPRLKMMMDAEGKMDGGEAEVVVDNVEIVRTMVTGIRNLTLKQGKEEVAIDTATKLLGENAPSFLSGLIDEIGAKLREVLQEKRVDAKN